MLEIQELSFDYGTTSLFDKININVKAGQLLHVRGNNGSGKTTLLKLLTGLLTPVTGDIRWLQQSIYTNLKQYQQQICYVGHKPGISLALTLLENCRYNTDNIYSEATLFKLLKQVDLDKLTSIPTRQLSAGQKKRLSLMRLVLNVTQLWVLDEPFTALDNDSIALFTQLIKTHLNHQGLVIITAHQSLPCSLNDHLEYWL